MLDDHSVVLPWRESWRRRLMRFSRRAARDRCDMMEDGKDGELSRIRRVQRLRTAPGYFSAQVDPSSQTRMLPGRPVVYPANYEIPPGPMHSPASPSLSSPLPPPSPPSGSSSLPRNGQPAATTARNSRMRSSLPQNDHGVISRPGPLHVRTQGDQPDFTYYHPYMAYHSAKH